MPVFLRCTIKIALILLLSSAFAQGEKPELIKISVPFVDKSDWPSRWPFGDDLSAYAPMSGGSYIHCWDGEEAIQNFPGVFPKNLSLLTPDADAMGFVPFALSCGNEIRSNGAGHFSFRHNFMGFEKPNKQIAYLLVSGESQAPEGEWKSSVSSLQRLSQGLYSFVRSSTGSNGYREEFVLFFLNEEGITLINGIPITYYSSQEFQNKPAQLEVLVNWPNTIDVKPISENLTLEQQSWVGQFSLQP